MKVIDLLNKIANGEEVPKKIKFDKYIFELDKLNTNYISEWGRNLTFHLGQFQEYALNDEIEIIEQVEDEFIDIDTINICMEEQSELADKVNDLIKNQKAIISKIKDSE